MEERPAVITITGRQGGARKPMELITAGSFGRAGDGYSVSYEESEMTGMDGSTTTIVAEGADRVVMTRSGTVNSRMVFEPGRRHMSHHDTGFGEMLICVSASSIENTLTDKGGRLSIDYTIEINNKIESKNSISLKVKGVKLGGTAKRSGTCEGRDNGGAQSRS